MDERADRGEFYPGGDRSGGAPAPQPSDKVDRVNVGEVGESYTLKDVKKKVNQIVRAIAPAVTCLALAVVRLLSYAATAPLEDIPNTAPVVTNEEDAVAMAAVGALGAAVSNRVEAAEGSLKAEIAGATNAVVQAALRAAEAESNRVESTYARRSEIPSAPDLAPYALKSELPTDYLTEGDITNFATRAWISAQGYATEAGVGVRLDAQDLAINATSQRVDTVDAELGNRLDSATNRVWQGVRAASNELARADARLDAKIEALELTGGMTRLWSSDATTWQDATGVVWRVEDALGPWQATTSSVQFVSWEDISTEEYDQWIINFTVEGKNAQGYAASPAGLKSYTVAASEWAYESGEGGEFDVNFVRPTIPGGATNAVNRVAYTNDIATIVPGNYETVSNRAMTASNYTDAVAADIRANYIPISGDVITDVELHMNRPLYEQGQLRLELPNGGNVDAKAFVGSTQITNQGAVAAATAMAVRKQDALPYPTNAIPYAAISGTPSLSGYATHAQVAEAAVAATNYTDKAISTNNEAFVSAVLAVPLTGADAGDLAEIAEYGSYATVGAAIVALIAGLAALKRGKADKAELPYDVVQATPSNGVMTVGPRTIATYTAQSSAVAFTVAVGVGETDKGRDCELVIDCTGSGAVAPTVTWPSNFHPRTDAATDVACEAGVRNVYYISEFSPGEFIVGGWQETDGGNE